MILNKDLIYDSKLATTIINQSEQFSVMFNNLHMGYIWKEGRIEAQIQAIENIVKVISNDIDQNEKRDSH